jgi:hypothetical protein
MPAHVCNLSRAAVCRCWATESLPFSQALHAAQHTQVGTQQQALPQPQVWKACRCADLPGSSCSGGVPLHVTTTVRDSADRMCHW